MTKRNMPDMAYSTGKPYGYDTPMVDAYGHVLHEGDEVFLLYSSMRRLCYVIDEIDGHIAYLQSLADIKVPPFPVLSDQIVKAKRREARVAKG
jgi:hypothetical protein